MKCHKFCRINWTEQIIKRNSSIHSISSKSQIIIMNFKPEMSPFHLAEFVWFICCIWGNIQKMEQRSVKISARYLEVWIIYSFGLFFQEWPVSPRTRISGFPAVSRYLRDIRRNKKMRPNFIFIPHCGLIRI